MFFADVFNSGKESLPSHLCRWRLRSTARRGHPCHAEARKREKTPHHNSWRAGTRHLSRKAAAREFRNQHRPLGSLGWSLFAASCAVLCYDHHLDGLRFFWQFCCVIIAPCVTVLLEVVAWLPSPHIRIEALFWMIESLLKDCVGKTQRLLDI